MTSEELSHFYEAALTGGAILSGFIGTFLSFRIQREANYYRQPVLNFERTDFKDVFLGLSRFPLSLALILMGALLSVLYGIFLPLSALAHWSLCTVSPTSILA